MHRYLAEFRMIDEHFDALKAEEDAFVASGTVYVFAKDFTDAAWHVKYFMPANAELVSIKRD